MGEGFRHLGSDGNGKGFTRPIGSRVRSVTSRGHSV